VRLWCRTDDGGNDDSSANARPTRSWRSISGDCPPPRSSAVSPATSSRRRASGRRGPDSEIRFSEEAVGAGSTS